MTDGPLMDQDKDDPWGIGGPEYRRESVVDTEGENQGVVVWGGPMLDPNMCYRCGEQGHWARQCRKVIQQEQYYPTQARGAQRMGYQAPNPGMAPVAQYPVADWGWGEEQY